MRVRVYSSAGQKREWGLLELESEADVSHRPQRRVLLRSSGLSSPQTSPYAHKDPLEKVRGHFQDLVLSFHPGIELGPPG